MYGKDTEKSKCSMFWGLENVVVVAVDFSFFDQKMPQGF